MTAPILVWLRRDLRLADHPALHEAAAQGPVVLAFCLDDHDGRAFGGASRWWLHHSLMTLGDAVTLAHGRCEVEIPRLAQACGARAVYWNTSSDPALIATEDRVRRALRTDSRTFPGDCLFQPGTVLNQSGGPFQVFTPFWRACLAQPAPARPLPAPRLSLAPCPGLPLDALGLMPRLDWWRGMARMWHPGEAGAAARLSDFLDKNVATYHTERDRPDRDATSMLSAHLAFGEISPRHIWHAAKACPPGDGVATFLKEVGWREFSRHLLARHPDLATRPLRPEFQGFPWRDDALALRQWQLGRTGYPIVDAGLRQLWATGWMHNRVRMIVASFLIKDLLIPWQAGEDWFWDTLVDADTANNAASWQWVAGCGADAAPFFRIFNPVLQGEKFDPKGDYVRAWVPELRHLGADHIHQPWKLGRQPNYPAPIIDHATARDRALAAFKGLKGEPVQTSLF